MPRVVFKPFQVAAKIHLPYFVCPRCGTSGVGSIHQHYSTFCPRLKFYPYAERSSESESEDESESSSDDYSHVITTAAVKVKVMKAITILKNNGKIGIEVNYCQNFRG